MCVHKVVCGRLQVKDVRRETPLLEILCMCAIVFIIIIIITFVINLVLFSS